MQDCWISYEHSSWSWQSIPEVVQIKLINEKYKIGESYESGENKYVNPSLLFGYLLLSYWTGLGYL